jgi:hypothetical protein
MPKARPDRILEKDIIEFVEQDSDFGFEMKVLNQLRSLNFECSHSATYQDPVTDLIRQFDIRAQKQVKNCTLKLAVECKNLRENYPLLLSAVPRTSAESFHQIMSQVTAGFPGLVTVQTVEHSNVYKPAEMVAKKTDQIGREQSGDLFSDDSGTFEKLNQALNSSRDVVQSAASADGPAPLHVVIVPVLVVPDELLWQVDYGEDGALLVPPRKVERVSLLIDYTWKVSGRFQNDLRYRLSHLEVVTLSALQKVLVDCLSPSGFFLGLFR